MNTLHYNYDDGLEFLQHCTNDELDKLVKLYEEKAERTSSLFSHKEYKKYAPDHKKYWELIAAELQYFGGNTFANIARRKGVKYKDVVVDVCKKQAIDYDEKADVAQLEKVFVYGYLRKQISKMNAPTKKDFQTKYHLLAMDEIALFDSLKTKIMSDGDFFKEMSTSLLNSLGKKLGKNALKNAAPFVAARFGARVVAPIALVILAKDISDPAFRVTIPSVLYIAYLRQKYYKQDLLYRPRFYPKVGSVVRTELVKGIDHSGVYIGEDKIIEIIEEKKRGNVKVQSVYDFVHATSLRTGVSVYIAVNKLSKEVLYDEKIADNAKKYIGKDNEYELFNNNCHSFVHKCITNQPFEKITKVWTFKDLTKTVQNHLNNGDEVEWVVCDFNPEEYKPKELPNKWKMENEII